MLRWLIRFLLVPISAAGIAVYGYSIAASASDDGEIVPSGPRLESIPPEAARQLPLQIAAARVRELDAVGGGGSLGGTEFDVAAQTLTIYWKGPMPENLTSIVDDMPPGYTAHISPSPYSGAELVAEARRIAALPSATTGVHILSVGPSAIYSGLDITTDDPLGAQRASIPTAYPVHIGAGVKGRPLTITRQQDAFPFSSGAVIVGPDGAGCSTGFPVAYAGHSTKQMLTAYHCDSASQHNSTFHNGNGSQGAGSLVVGTASSCCSSTDVMQLSGKTYSPWIYIGSYTSATVDAVDAADYPSVGQYLCYGGAYSGEVCSNLVTATGQMFNGKGPGFYTTQINGVTAAGNGDSGGPVYGYDGWGGVVGYGIIDQGNDAGSTTCQGVPGDPIVRQCYVHVFSADLSEALYDLGVGIAPAAGTIRNRQSTRCLDADTNTIGSNGTKIQLWDCSGASNQAWYFPADGTIRNGYNGRCLDADTNTINNNGTKIQLWDCTGADNQWWQIPGNRTITNKHSGRVLDADTNTIGANGTKVQLWDYLGNQNQQWYTA